MNRPSRQPNCPNRLCTRDTGLNLMASQKPGVTDDIGLFSCFGVLVFSHSGVLCCGTDIAMTSQ